MSRTEVVQVSQFDAPVVLAKITPPRVRPNALVRDRVAELVAHAAGEPLTLVTASAGWGKTTTLALWARTATMPVAWLTLDAGDDEPRRLWEHLIAALDRVVPGALQAARFALRGGAGLVDSVVPLVVNALEQHAGDGLAIVIDDYHHVVDPAGHRALLAFLDTAPPCAHVVIASRTVPPLRLSRRRAAGAVVLGVRELAFTREESAALLRDRLRLRLDAAELERVDARVAGWPAGLAFVATTLAEANGRSVSEALGSAGALMEEYLVEEVLDQLPADLRELLVRTAIVVELDASLCETIAGIPGARELLADARRANLLLPVERDDPHHVARYRCHPVLAEVLRSELDARPPAVVAQLHLRAARWFAQAGHAERAITHASLAGDGELAARVLHDAAPRMLGHGRHETVRRLIDAMPADRGAFGPFTAAARLYTLQLDGAEPSLVYERWQEMDDARDAPGVARIADAARVWPFFGRIGEGVRFGWGAYEELRAAPPELRHSLAGQLGLVLFFAGDPAAGQAIVERHLDAMVYPLSKSWAWATLALCAAQEGDGDAARSHADRAVALAHRHKRGEQLAFSIAFQAQADALRLCGRLDAARHVLDHLEAVTGRHPGSIHHALTLILRAEVHLARHERVEARRAVAHGRRLLGQFPDVGILEQRAAAVEALLERRADDTLVGSTPTAAEQRVLELLARGLTLEAIAGELFVTIHTIKSHTRRLYRRLGATNRGEAIAAARRRGLL